MARTPAGHDKNMNYSNRAFLYGPVGAFLALILGLALYWFHASGQLSERIDALNGKTIMPGVTLHFSGEEMAGFPFRLDTIFKDLEIDVETDHGLAVWKSENFAMHALTYGRPLQVMEAAGKQTLTWTNAKGEHKTFEFIPGLLHASAVEDATGLTRFDIDLVDLGAAEFQAAELQFHIRKEGDNLEFVFDGNTLHLSDTKSGFGDTIKSLHLSGEINHGEALNALRAGAQDWRPATDAWNAKNGKINLDAGHVAWGKTGMDVAGEFVLPERQLRALLSLKMTGVPLEQPGENDGATGFAVALSDWASSNAKDGNVTATFTLGQERGFIGLPGSAKTERVY